MSDALAFGQDLRRARERCGLSLEQIADKTKISASLFAGLERGDLSRWPSGIFRRAFVRSYAEAIGLDAEETVGRFLSLHADEGDEGAKPRSGAPSGPAAAVAPPRLTLVSRDAATENAGPSSGTWRAGAPLVDVLIALVPAVLLSHLAGWEWFWMATAGSAVTVHVVGSWAGATPGVLLLRPPPTGTTDRALAAPIGEAMPSALVEAGSAPAPSAQPAPALRRRQPRHASGPRPVPPRQQRRAQH